MYDRYNKTTEIKYKNKDDLKKLLNENYNETGCLSFYPDGKKQKLYIGESTGNGKITLDLQEGTVTVDGADGDYIFIYKINYIFTKTLFSPIILPL